MERRFSPPALGMTGEMGRGWWRGSFEYGFDVFPLFLHLKPERLYGDGFEPVILRWNSSLQTKRVAPHTELAGGAVPRQIQISQPETPPTSISLPEAADFRFSLQTGNPSILAATRRTSPRQLGVENPEFNGIQVSVGYHWFE